jgi:uncharacterized repeat protein (TIGR04052 family)
MNNRTAILMATLALASFGCDSSSGGTGGTGGEGTSQPVSIQFAGKVGADDFVCGDTYDNLGANDNSLKLTDFRFYVQDVEVQNAESEWVVVELAQNEFQVDDVALLDFEDGCGEFGNPDLNDLVSGTVPEGEYVGVRFKMGVPVDLNHADASTAPGPLGLTSMFWSWRGGYKFLRIDSGNIKADPAIWRTHLGSTGCGMTDDPTTPPEQPCTNENRVAVDLDAFDLENDVVVADIAALVEGTPLDENAEGTPTGCMAAPDDSDCGPIFDNLGLPFDGSERGIQQFFSIE